MSEHELWNELGNLYFMSGAYEQATHAYRRSIQIDSGFGRPYSNLALTYTQLGKHEEAIWLFRRGIELLEDNKEKAISWMRLGNVFRQLKDYREAVFAYQNADELDPESSGNRDESSQGLYTPSSQSFLGTDSTEAISKTESTAALDLPASADSNDAVRSLTQDAEPIAQAPAKKEELEEIAVVMPKQPFREDYTDHILEEDLASLVPTQADLEPVVSAIENDNLQNWITLVPTSDSNPEQMPEEIIEDNQPAISESDLELESYDQSIDPPDLMISVESNNLNISAFEEKAPIHTQTDVAIDELPSNTLTIFKTKELQPAQILYKSELGDPNNSPLTRQNQKDIEKAEYEIQRLKRVVQINPRSGFAWDKLGNLYKSINQFKEAIFAYQQAISTNDSKPFYYYHIALVYAASGYQEDAISALQKVIELDANYGLAHATLGGYYRKMGLEELAQNHINKAMKTIFDSENEYNRACFEAICGNADHAIDLLRIALEEKQTSVDWVLRDPDLDFVRNEPRFKQLISDFTR